MCRPSSFRRHAVHAKAPRDEEIGTEEELDAELERVQQQFANDNQRNAGI